MPSHTIDIPPPTPSEWLRMRRMLHEAEPMRTYRREVARWLREARSQDRRRTYVLWKLLQANAQRLLDSYAQEPGYFADLIAPRH